MKDIDVSSKRGPIPTIRDSIPGDPERRQWDAVKGALILCVVLGHSSLANTVLPPLKGLVYAFHVQGFLLLPFLYGRQMLSGRSAANICIRYLVPYAVFVVAYSVMNQVSEPQAVTVWLYHLARGLVTGNDLYLKEATGLYLLWFLPVITLVTLFRGLYDSRSGWLRWICLVVLVGCHFALPAISWPIKRVFPLFGSHIALYVMALGLSAGWIWQRLGYRRVRSLRYLTLLGSMGALTIMLMTGSLVNLGHLGVPSYRQPGLMLLHDVIPVLVLFALVGFSHVLAVVPSLAYIGQRTLPIYLMHQVVLVVSTASFVKAMPESLGLWGEIVIGAMTVVIGIAIPVGIMYGMNALPRLKRLLFPRGVEDVLGRRSVVVTA